MTSRQIRRRQRFIYVFFGVLALLIGAWGALEWDLRRMENAIWDHGDFSGLEKREKLLNWVATHRLTPAHLKGRVNGLLGDSSFQEDKSKAYEYYLKSTVPFLAFFSKGQIDPKLMIDQFRLADSDFARGVADQKTAAFTAPPLNDEGMKQPSSRFEDTGENCRDALMTIQPLDEMDREKVITLFREADTEPRWDEMRDFCKKHRGTIKQLNELGIRFVASVDKQPELFGHICQFIRLVATDAFSQANRGNKAEAKRSLNCAYRLLGYLEQNPNLMNGLVETSLRGSIIEFLHSQHGEPLRNHFEKRHVMIEDPYFWCITGTYHSTKKLLSDAIVGQGTLEKKLRYLIQKKNFEYWRKIRDDGVEPSESREENSLEISMARWFFKNRNLFYRRTSGSYGDGREFYASIENMTAQIIFMTALPNGGRFRESLEDIRERELALFRGEVEPSIKEIDEEPLSPEIQKMITEAKKDAGLSETK